MFRLETLQERREGEDIEDGMEDVKVDEGEGVDAVHYLSGSASNPRPGRSKHTERRRRISLRQRHLSMSHARKRCRQGRNQD